MNKHVAFDLDFKRNPYKGTYIALEGIDGCGKTTQTKRLQEYFEKKGKTVIRTSEPRADIFLGEQIMNVLESKIRINPAAFQHLATANRLINHEEIIIPALEKGSYVFSDRSFWSALAYGIMDKNGTGYSRKEADIMLLSQSILSHYHQSIVPDLVFYLHISSATGIKRLSDRKNRVNDLYEKKEKLERVVKGYQWLTKEFSDQFIVIDGEKSVEEITQEMIGRIEGGEWKVEGK